MPTRGGRLWMRRVDDHPLGANHRIADVLRGPALRAGVLLRRGARRRSAVSVLYVSRKHFGARCRIGRGRVEDVHDRGAAAATRHERIAGVPLWGPAGRASGRRQPSTQRAAPCTWRPATPTAHRPRPRAMPSWRWTLRRARFAGRGKSTANDVYVSQLSRRQSQLSRVTRPRSRLRQPAGARARRRPRCDRDRTEVGNRVRDGSREEGRDPLAVSRRAGRRARRHRVGRGEPMASAPTSPCRTSPRRSREVFTR